MLMLPPNRVWMLAPKLPTTLRERTVMPRTMPIVRAMRWPSISKAVVMGKGGGWRRDEVGRGLFADGGAGGRPALDEAEGLDDGPVLLDARLRVREALGDAVVEAPRRDDLDAEIGHALDGHADGTDER